MLNIILIPVPVLTFSSVELFGQMNDNFEPIVLVARGDELPKKNYEKKVHPTYEVTVHIISPQTMIKSTHHLFSICTTLW